MKMCVLVVSMCAALGFSSISPAQTANRRKSFEINGQAGDAAVVLVEGREYIELEALVRITNGSMSFRNGRTSLTLPTFQPTESQPSTDTNRLSREFAKAGIEEIALLREWASPLATAIQNGFPVTENWVAALQSRAKSGLGTASVSSSTVADQNALVLLNKEFEAVQEWSDNLVQARKSLNTANYALSPDALRNEPLSQQIITCGRFLASMLASGAFQNDGSCH